MKKVCFLVVFFLCFYSSGVYATDDTHQMVENQLLIYELKRDLLHTEIEIQEIEKRIPEIQQELKENKEKLRKREEHAADLLRIMQERGKTFWWEFIFSADGIGDFFHRLYAFQIITSNEADILTTYYENLEKVNSLLLLVENEKRELVSLQNDYSKKLIMLGVSEEELAKEIQSYQDPEFIKKYVSDVLDKWEHVGIDTFSFFFKELSKAMLFLPEQLSSDNIKNLSLFKVQITITEKELNSFLKKQNSLFSQSSFSFDQQYMIVQGKHNDVQLYLKGSFEVTDNRNLQFFISELKFDEFSLPEATIEQLEKEFDLGFYPSYFYESAKVTSFDLSDGSLKMIIEI